MNNSLNLLSYFFKQENTKMSSRRKRPITETDDSNVMPPKKKALKPEEISDQETESSVLFEIENNVTATPTKKKKKKHRELDDINLQNVTDGIKNTSTENVAENSVLSEAVEMTAKKKKKKKSKKNISTGNIVDDEEHLAVSEDQNDEAKNVDKEKIDTEMSFSETKRMFDDIQQKLMSSKFVNSKRFWDEYSFQPYSHENCRSAFDKIMTKVQKKRTMLELVSAAGKLMEESPKIFFDKNKQIKPISAFKLYSETNYKKISKKHPEYRGIQILNKLTKKWAKLSDHKKLKYIDLALAKRDDYVEEIKHCYQIDPSFVAKPILSKGEWQLKDRCSGLPDTPPRNGFTLFHQKSGELYVDLSPLDRVKNLNKDFKLLPDEVKKQYDNEAKKQMQNYKEALDTYLDSLSPGEREERSYTFNYKAKKSKEKTGSKSSDKHVEKIIMKKPPQSGYLLYYSELTEVLKYVPVIQRHVIVSEKWKALSEDERAEYNKKRLFLYNEWLDKLKLSVNEDIAENNTNGD